ncbi:MAG: alpha/beta fold hydrolase [Armatimonadetes bacterium]|nr:alpha/beta fold hydrolase [Armatimonadota bacterium]
MISGTIRYGIVLDNRFVLIFVSSLWAPEPAGNVVSQVPLYEKLTRDALEFGEPAMRRLTAALVGLGSSGKKLTLEMVDARAFNDPTRNVSQGPKDGFPISSVSDVQLKSFATGQPVVSKVAADGVTLLLLRTEVPEAGSVTFELDGPGSLYLLTRDPFVAAGGSSTQARSRLVDLHLPSGPRNYAFALYRPPPMLPGDGNWNFAIRANFKPNVETAKVISGEASGTLVRPPVVLVHGTYDNPKECWNTKDADDAPQTMYQSLTEAGFRVFCVDWEKTNGREDPSDFDTNRMTVYQEKNGIRDALEAFRKDGIAVTQADVVAHSQGGVITRVFARGRPLTRSISITDPHCGDTQACREHGCWYHTKRNFGQGDIRRFITISSTHRGSDIPGLFKGIVAVRDKSPAAGATRIWFANFIDAMQYWMTGVKTGGFKDQMPGSKALRDIGPTPIKSHAIAIVCSDEIMETRKSGFYLGRLKKLWTAIPRHEIERVFAAIDQEADGEKLHASAVKYANLGWTADRSEPYRDLLREFRRAVFRGEENDCVVALSSSCGGLSTEHISKVAGYVHSYAPRETEVQMLTLELLRGSEDPFDPRGFPDTYAGTFAAGTAGTKRSALDNQPTVASAPKTAVAPVPPPVSGPPKEVPPPDKCVSDLLAQTFGTHSGIRAGKLVLIEVERGSPGDHMGLGSGDRILRIGDKNLDGLMAAELQALAHAPLRAPLEIELLRGGDQARVVVTLIERAPAGYAMTVTVVPGPAQ